MTRSSIDSYFARDYATCREKFRASAERLGLPQQSFVNPVAGPNGETLATDTALFGDPDATNLIILISGTHGLEAFAGSGIQLGLLDACSRETLNGTAILFVHALNPWGAANLRRQNEDNIDVNRNFLDPSDLPIDNRYYDLLHPIIHRTDLFVGPQRNHEANQEIESFVNKHGNAAFYSALFQGQSRHADGVGFCGVEPCWSNRTINHICQNIDVDKARIAIIDLHTGLGPFGHGTLMSTQATNGSNFEIARRWFGDDLIPVLEDNSLPYQPIGDMLGALLPLFADHTTVIGVALEFGTYDEKSLMQTQIDDSWLEQFGVESSSARESIKQASVNFFYPDSSEWRERVLLRSKRAIARVAREMRK